MPYIYTAPGILQVYFYVPLYVLPEQLYIVGLCQAGFSLIRVHITCVHRILGVCLVPLVLMQDTSEIRHNLNVLKTIHSTKQKLVDSEGMGSVTILITIILMMFI